MLLETALDFLEPLNLDEISEDEGYFSTQIGNNIEFFGETFPDISNADLIIVGCAESRGGGVQNKGSNGPDFIRKEFYRLYYWHTQIKIVDIGNIKQGASINDSIAALKYVLKELQILQKKVLILGGSHDLTMAQYGAYASIEQIIEAAIIDARIDLNIESVTPSDNFLVEMLTSEPNFLKHYHHIGFQSYFVHPTMLETIDKLRFDCYRVGNIKENIEEIEPAIRNANFLSFDISAIQSAFAPANRVSPNGFTGEESCKLLQYAGLSNNISTIGIYGYFPELDINQQTAKQISQMLWYLLDGVQKFQLEATFSDKESFNEFLLNFAEFETTFIQSKNSGRWWMKSHEGNFIACSFGDYLIARNNDIPERWLRSLERS